MARTASVSLVSNNTAERPFDFTTIVEAKRQRLSELTAAYRHLTQRIGWDAYTLGNDLQEMQEIAGPHFPRYCESVLNITVRTARRWMSMSNLIKSNFQEQLDNPQAPIFGIKASLLTHLAGADENVVASIRNADSVTEANGILESLRQESQENRDKLLETEERAASLQTELRSTQQQNQELQKSTAIAQLRLKETEESYKNVMDELRASRDDVQKVRQQLEELKKRPVETTEFIPPGYKTLAHAIEAKQKELNNSEARLAKLKTLTEEHERALQQRTSEAKAAESAREILASCERDISALMVKYSGAVISGLVSTNKQMKERFKKLADGLHLLADQIAVGAK